MRSFVNHALPLAALTLLSGCTLLGADSPAPAPPLPTSGPGADYPVVVGEPFTIGTVTYEPSEALNYDAVGYASISADVDSGISAAHKTLPLPSYAEVTDLQTGRTILVRVETRGPMVNDRLIALSAAAADQLGIAATTPVRVRRVNPPEQERALLRQGEEAPLRIETPAPLRAVLKRKLEVQEPLLTASVPANSPIVSQDPDLGLKNVNAPQPEPDSQPEQITQPNSAPAPVSQPAAGEYVVQVAAFSTEARAENAARAIGGSVIRLGRYWQVRIGPFATRGDAQAGLEKARANGYSDARIQRTE